MAQYAADCAPARPILVEHDITFDLYPATAPDQRRLGPAPSVEAVAALRNRRVARDGVRRHHVREGPGPGDWSARGRLAEWRRPGPVSCCAASAGTAPAVVRGVLLPLAQPHGRGFLSRPGVAPAAGRPAAHHCRRAARVLPRLSRFPGEGAPGPARGGSGGIRCRCARRLRARRDRGGAAGGVGGNQSQDSGSHGLWPTGDRHARRRQRAGPGSGRGLHAGSHRRGDGGRHRQAAGLTRRVSSSGGRRPAARGRPVRLGRDRAPADGAVPRGDGRLMQIEN